ncbi:hypothetical protein JL09_g5363, partial [Pichia kudriavzevii]
MMNRTGSEHILNKNTLVIPNYQANSAGIKHIMSSVYENPELDRGRSDTKGVIKPANKFAVESSVVDHSKEKLNLPGINIENVGGNVVVENNGVSNPDDISNEILHDKENAVLDSSDLSPIHISNSIKDIDDELKKIIGDSEQGKLAKVSQHQHSSSTASVYNVPDHENITSGTLTCSKCGSTDFNSAPMDAVVPNIQDRTFEFQQAVNTFAKQQHVESRSAPAPKPSTQKSEFNRQAGYIAKDIVRVTGALHKLAQLSKRKQLFGDKPTDIVELTYIIKQDIFKIEKELKGLKSLQVN